MVVLISNDCLVYVVIRTLSMIVCLTCGLCFVFMHITIGSFLNLKQTKDHGLHRFVVYVGRLDLNFFETHGFCLYIKKIMKYIFIPFSSPFF